MKFKCDVCGYDKFEIRYNQVEHLESEELTEFPDVKFPSEVIKWYDAGESEDYWAVCLGCEKEFDFQSGIEEVKQDLIKIGVLI